jgi:antitoxin YefM
MPTARKRLPTSLPLGCFAQTRHISNVEQPIFAPIYGQVVRADMKIVTYSEARSGLKTVLDRVHEDADVTVISRRDGADAVVMSLDHYQSIMETMHLLSTPANAAHLSKSIAQHQAGKIRRRELLKG